MLCHAFITVDFPLKSNRITESVGQTIEFGVCLYIIKQSFDNCGLTLFFDVETDCSITINLSTTPIENRHLENHADMLLSFNILET